MSKISLLENDQSNIKNLYENEFDSRYINHPNIKIENFIKNIKQQTGIYLDIHKKNNTDLKHMDYNILKEIFDKCGYFPEKHRIYIWKYLLSLPNNKNSFELFLSYGIHPYFKDLDFVKDKYLNNRVKFFCSLITNWSPHIGKIYYLENLVYPFIRYIKGDDIFLFEILLIIINTYCQYWFKNYPSPPMKDLEIIETIIKIETPSIISHFKTLGDDNKNMFNLINIVWKLIQSLYSTIFKRDEWLKLIDFLFIYSYKPEMLIYFTSAYVINYCKSILRAKDIDSVENILLKENIVDMKKLLIKTNKLHQKYNKFQKIGYVPYIPFPQQNYPVIDKFPEDFIESTERIRKEIFSEELFIDKINEDEIEEKLIELKSTDNKMKECYLNLIKKENEKSNIFKKELDLILYQKNKYYNESKFKKLMQIDGLNNQIEQNINFFKNLNNSDNNQINRTIKQMHQMDVMNRLQEEELNNMKLEANMKILDLMEHKHMNELEKNFKDNNKNSIDFMKNKLDEIRFKEDEIKIKNDNKMIDCNKSQTIERLRNNFNQIVKEEKELLKKESSLNINEIDLKTNLKYLNQNEINESINNIQKLRNSYRSKKEDLELNKKLIINSLDKIIDYSLSDYASFNNTLNTESGRIKEAQENIKEGSVIENVPDISFGNKNNLKKSKEDDYQKSDRNTNLSLKLSNQYLSIDKHDSIGRRGFIDDRFYQRDSLSLTNSNNSLN